MKIFLINTKLLFQNNLEVLKSVEHDKNLSTLISILTIGFITLLLLLTISLYKTHKLKKRIKQLESQK